MLYINGRYGRCTILIFSRYQNNMQSNSTTIFINDIIDIHQQLNSIEVCHIYRGKITEYGQCQNTDTFGISETINPTKKMLVNKIFITL